MVVNCNALRRLDELDVLATQLHHVLGIRRQRRKPVRPPVSV